MTQVVKYQETYTDLNTLLNRIGYIRTMIMCPVVQSKQFENELLDREIELLEHVSRLDNEHVIFTTVNFGQINACKAREICDTLQLSHACMN